MGLFKDTKCACCEGKTNVVTRSKLKDGNYVCLNCKPAIPMYVLNCLGEYDLDAFKKLQEYAVFSENIIRKKFKKTHSFHSIYLDANNGYFYIDGGVLSNQLYLEIEDIESFELWYEPDKYKEGLLEGRVTGKIKLSITMYNPYFKYETDLASGVKAFAHTTGLFTKKVKYENPRGMDEFLKQFKDTHHKFLYSTDKATRF